MQRGSTVTIKTNFPQNHTMSYPDLPLENDDKDQESLLSENSAPHFEFQVQEPIVTPGPETRENSSSSTLKALSVDQEETDVLPAYEIKLPVNPLPTEEPSLTGNAAREAGGTVVIQPEKGDNVEGNWFIISQLGEGAYGDVKLIEDVHQRRLLAMKIICHHSVKENRSFNPDLVKREILVHQNLYHDNIIRFIGNRVSEKETFIFLEYACGGELYDRIEPDFGVPRNKCQKWFAQLLDGLEYLHHRGIVHRDIKPENLLLNETDDIKISDFGLATLFRVDNKLRMLNTRRGTPSYVAPEVYARNTFHAQPLDIWSAGVVLLAMISGELPWEVATLDHQAFCCWRMGSLTISPWTKIPGECIALFRKMLDPNPDTRATIEVIRSNHWFKRGFTERAVYAPPPKRVRYDLETHVLSVPVQHYSTDGWESSSQADITKVLSQPVRLEDLLLSQSQGVGALVEQSPLARLVKRMTRFFITCGVKEAVETLTEILTQMHMSITHTSPGSYTISGQDRCKGALVMKVSFVQLSKQLLMDFRLSKGDGLQFKRIFATLREKLNNLVDDGPVSWAAVNDHSHDAQG